MISKKYLVIILLVVVAQFIYTLINYQIQQDTTPPEGTKTYLILGKASHGLMSPYNIGGGSFEVHNLFDEIDSNGHFRLYLFYEGYPIEKDTLNNSILCTMENIRFEYFKAGNSTHVIAFCGERKRCSVLSIFKKLYDDDFKCVEPLSHDICMFEEKFEENKHAMTIFLSIKRLSIERQHRGVLPTTNVQLNCNFFNGRKTTMYYEEER